MQVERELAILFADVSGSTQLYEVLGDFRARETVASCVAAMIEATSGHGGTLIKTIGDEVMSTFPSPDAAVEAAVDMQQKISAHPVVDGRQLTIRVGCHFGPVICEEADVYGDAVNVASRVANQAKPGQILTTGATIDRVSAELRDCCRQIARTTVKGKREPIDLFEVIWQEEDVTVMQRPPWVTAAQAVGGKLALSAKGCRLELGEKVSTVTVGRANENDLVVKGDMVSRLHARIEYRNGRFIITDQSANGTYVVGEAGDSTYVHRDNFVLRGAGMLGLGSPPVPDAPTTVRFQAST